MSVGCRMPHLESKAPPDVGEQYVDMWDAVVSVKSISEQYFFIQGAEREHRVGCRHLIVVRIVGGDYLCLG